MVFHESYGTVPSSTLRVIKACNVSPADWDSMFARWGFGWGDTNLPWDAIERHIETHSQRGSYSYPMYG